MRADHEMCPKEPKTPKIGNSQFPTSEGIPSRAWQRKVRAARQPATWRSNFRRKIYKFPGKVGIGITDLSSDCGTPKPAKTLYFLPAPVLARTENPLCCDVNVDEIHVTCRETPII